MAYTKEQLFELVDKAFIYNNIYHDQIASMLDVKLVDAKDGDEPRFVFSYKVSPEHRNLYLGVHGGMSALILDELIGVAGDAYTGKNTSTTDFSLSYHRPMMGDEYLVIIEFPKIGNKLLSATGYIADAQGKKYVTCQIRYALLPKNK